MFITAAKAAETANSAASAGGGASFPPFDPTTFAPTLVWLVITFGLLYWLMSRIALPRVGEILDSRRSRIEGDLATASNAQKSANDAAAAYEETIADAKAKAQATAQQMRAQISGESDTRRKALEEQLNGKIAAAETQIEAMKAQAMSNVSTIAQEAAGDIVKHLTGIAPDAAALAAAFSAGKAS